jgi:methylated-DNA-protein-cysteine methyltransferase-like protein
MMNDFSQRIIETIKKIPEGSVATYGQIAAIAGNSRAARTVSWILNSSSEKHDLPWHRVVNSKGFISLKGEGYELQKQLLRQEGVKFGKNDRINLKKYLWNP